MSSERTWLSANLFTDIVGYSKHSIEQQVKIKDHFQSNIEQSISALNSDETILLDTGDGISPFVC